MSSDEDTAFFGINLDGDFDPGVTLTLTLPNGTKEVYDATVGWLPEAEVLKTGNGRAFDDTDSAVDCVAQHIRQWARENWKPTNITGQGG